MSGPFEPARSSFGEPDIDIVRLRGGVTEVRSRTTPSAAPTSTLHWLQHWATVTPSMPFLSEALEGRRIFVDYATAWDAVTRTASALQGLGVGRGDRVVVVAHNGLDSFVVGHAAMLAGAIWVPIAPQYLGLEADRARMAQVLELVDPTILFVPDDTLRSRVPQGYDVVGRIATDPSESNGTNLLGRLVGRDTAKLLLTSGSTGLPKAVVYTHRMLVSNVRATADVWKFVTDHPPVLVDWLPWNHAFGGNANLNMVLLAGGTLHIDDARGQPSGLARSIATITEFEPTFYAAVPAGFHAMLPALEADSAFRRALFGRCDALFSAGAAMPATVFQRLRDLSRTVRSKPVPVLTGWGSTETGPGATIVHAADSAPGWIGPPLPGVTIRLVPVEDKLELRVKSSAVMPCYWREPGRTEMAFDADGFYCSGDAGALIDDQRPELGLRFDGRIADDFKLANGSWVNVDRLRARLLALAGSDVRDVVIAGADRPYLVALFWMAHGRTIDVQACLLAHNSTASGQTNVIVTGAALDADPAAHLLSPKGLIKPVMFRAVESATIDALYEPAHTPSEENR